MGKFEIYVHGKLLIKDSDELNAMTSYFILRQRYGDSNVEMKVVQIDNMKRWWHNIKYKIGDTVKIRSWEEMEAQFGLDNDGDIACPGVFTKDMAELCNKEVEIVDVFFVNYNKPMSIYQVCDSNSFLYNEMFSSE